MWGESVELQHQCSKLVKALVTDESLFSIRKYIPKRMSLRATLLEKLLFTVGPSFPTRKSVTGENAISIRSVGKLYLTSVKAALFDIRKSTRARDCIKCDDCKDAFIQRGNLIEPYVKGVGRKAFTQKSGLIALENPHRR